MSRPYVSSWTSYVTITMAHRCSLGLELTFNHSDFDLQVNGGNTRARIMFLALDDLLALE